MFFLQRYVQKTLTPDDSFAGWVGSDSWQELKPDIDARNPANAAFTTDAADSITSQQQQAVFRRMLV